MLLLAINLFEGQGNSYKKLFAIVVILSSQRLEILLFCSNSGGNFFLTFPSLKVCSSASRLTQWFSDFLPPLPPNRCKRFSAIECESV